MASAHLLNRGCKPSPHGCQLLRVPFSTPAKLAGTTRVARLSVGCANSHTAWPIMTWSTGCTRPSLMSLSRCAQLSMKSTSSQKLLWPHASVSGDRTASCLASTNRFSCSSAHQSLKVAARMQAGKLQLSLALISMDMRSTASRLCDIRFNRSLLRR